MQPHREYGSRGRRVVATIHWALLVTLVIGATTLAPRPLRAQSPQPAVVVANVARWMVRWIGQYLVGRGVDIARERARGHAFRRELQQVERVLRRQISSNSANRSRHTRELRLVENQLRMIDGAMGANFSRDSARVYFARVNRDMDELREVVITVAGGMSGAIETIENMQREIDELRNEVANLRSQRYAGRDERDYGDDDERWESRAPSFNLPAGLHLGVGYAASEFAFTVPAYGGVSASQVSRRQQGAAARIGVGGGIFQLGISASALGAWLDTTDNVGATETAARQPLQSVTVGADFAIALTPRWVMRPWIGGAAEQIWMSFRTLPGAIESDIVFSGLVYGPQAGLEFRLTDAFSVSLIGRMMSGKLRVPTHQLPGLEDATLMAPVRRNQLTAILSYSDRH